MATKKLFAKRSRRDAAAEGTSAAPEFDSHRFRSAEHQQRFEAIKGWSFHRERRVQLRDDEYTEFQEEIAHRHWTSMVTPMAKFDPDIVLEFYANAWPIEDGVRDMRSWAQADAPQAVDAPPPPHQADPVGSFGMERYLQHLVHQQVANHRGQFRAKVAWPEDWLEAQAGEAPGEAPDDAEEAHMDEEMTNLLSFLGGSGAT
eukprot:XP_025981193.1 uncharacterized protein LOC102669685 [Glycine max]